MTNAADQVKMTSETFQKSCALVENLQKEISVAQAEYANQGASARKDESTQSPRSPDTPIRKTAILSFQNDRTKHRTSYPSPLIINAILYKLRKLSICYLTLGLQLCDVDYKVICSRGVNDGCPTAMCGLL